MAITITGTLISVELRRSKDPDYLGIGRYSPNSERYLITLNCCVEADGRRYYFDTVPARMVVANAPGVAIVHYDAEGEPGKWLRVLGGSAVATAQRPNENGIEPLVRAGDTITIRASIKSEHANYTRLNRVKRKEAGT